MTNKGGAYSMTEYKNAYASANYDRLYVFVPKGSKELIRAAAQAQGKTLNEYVTGFIPANLMIERHGRIENNVDSGAE